MSTPARAAIWRTIDANVLERNEPAERTIYEAVVTVCMRLIFLLAAEARGLLPDDEPWLESYAVGSLRADLQAIADRSGEELLDRRFDAWPRLLATFRAVHSGVEHDRVRLPGYGGGLFDPSRYPFLEQAGGSVPRVSNRVILRILDSLQTLEVPVPGAGRERRPLSYRALGVEQIGHVYERLLDHTAIRADAPALGLIGTAKKEPEIGIELLERKRANGTDALLTLLVEVTGRSRSALKNALEKPPPVERTVTLAQACQHDGELIDAVLPYLGLVRDDAYGVPTVFLPGSIYVTESEERGSTGTYYTPPSLTEPIVQYALEPVVYRGPAEGSAREQWELKRPSEILELKVCDIAMGSAAFLVAACRYLAARLVEAWDIHPEEAPLDAGADVEERDLTARRIVTERCLYGVDVNRLAVDIAKVSLWLTTLRRDRPFTFVDHALRCGDSLLGLTSIEQLEALTLWPEAARSVLLEPAREAIRATLIDVQQAREEIEATDAVDLRQVQQKTLELERAAEKLDALEVVGNLVVGTALADAAGAVSAQTIVEAAADAICVAFAVDDPEARSARLTEVAGVADEGLLRGRAPGSPTPPRPFHWALEYPEVFGRENSGFDATVGNPPFLGGQKITGSLGEPYREYLVKALADNRRGSADLVSYFFLRANSALRLGGAFGLVATNTIGQGDTRQVALDAICADGSSLIRANRSQQWPGEATVYVSHIWGIRGSWDGQSVLDELCVPRINSALDPDGRVDGLPFRLAAGADHAFQGSIVLGSGFLITAHQAHDLIEADSRNATVLQPYVNADELADQAEPSPSRWAINFRDLDRAEAAKFESIFSIVDRVVRPEREKVRYSKRARELWWQYERPRLDLYEAIADFNRVLVGPQTAKYFFVTWCENGWVYSHALNVFVYEDNGHAAVLSSAFHDAWARKYSGSLETRLRYSPTDCFQNFPFPDDVSTLDAIGDHYLTCRNGVLLAENQGLTKIYNRVHEQPQDTSDPIQELRRLRRELDRAVADAYGWIDLEMDHDFRETPLGLRYTLSEPVKTEALDRLLELNHARYQEEVALGLHAKKPAKPRPKMASQALQPDERLFD